LAITKYDVTKETPFFFAKQRFFLSSFE